VHSLLGLTTPFALIPSYSTPFELRHALNLTKCTRLFVSAQLLPLVLPVVEDAGMSSDRIYIIGGTACGRKSLSKLIEGARTKNTPAVAARPAVKDTLAYLVLSSGTTGPPKGLYPYL
jgi:long-subunit acyl-CoA synthetase (AMP-forming)